MNDIVTVIKQNLDLSQNRPIKDLVYEALRKTIILGDILSGERINEKNLSEALNISRTPIRYAIKQLADEGLVERKAGVGVIVKGITMRDATEIFDIRKNLEVLATRKAMMRMTREQYAQLERLLDETESLDRAEKVDQVIDNFTAFNDFIYTAAKMPRLKLIVDNLQAYLVYFRNISIKAKARRALAIHEHRLIYQGMINRDEKQVSMIVDEHLERSLQFILAEMRLRNLD